MHVAIILFNYGTILLDCGPVLPMVMKRYLCQWVAGCVDTFLSRGNLNLSQIAVLELCYRDPTCLIPMLDDEGKAYYHRLELLAELDPSQNFVSTANQNLSTYRTRVAAVKESKLHLNPSLDWNTPICRYQLQTAMQLSKASPDAV